MLNLPLPVHEDILAHAREGMPLEVCGILAGKRDGNRRDVVQSWRVANVHPEPRTRSLVDPKEQLRITLEAEDDLGLEIVGFYHSHPRGAPVLSVTDKARAKDSSWTGASYLLVWYPGQPEEGMGSWEWNADREDFEGEPLHVEGEAVPLRQPFELDSAFLVDVAGEKAHRRDKMGPACEDEIDWRRAQFAADELKAGMILKTRHYAPCPRCW